MSDLNFHARTAISSRLNQTRAAVVGFARGDHDAVEVGLALSQLRFQAGITERIAPVEAGALRGTADLVELTYRAAERAARAGNVHRFDELNRDALKALDLAREIILPKD